VTSAAVVVLGYVLGSCPWGYWLVRLFRGEDVRRVGSGNIGLTNVWRAYKSPAITIPHVLLDFGKGFAPALVGVLLVSRVAGIAAGAAAMLGHWRPLFLGFQKGGKMVATAGGVYFAVSPLLAVTALGVWVVVFCILGYSSVASLSAAIAIPVGAWLYDYPAALVAFASAALVVILVLHRDNLKRLRRRTETRWGGALVPMLSRRLRPSEQRASWTRAD
jgi:glycerol-3-phosphate acyltransferase PlsY